MDIDTDNIVFNAVKNVLNVYLIFSSVINSGFFEQLKLSLVILSNIYSVSITLPMSKLDV